MRAGGQIRAIPGALIGFDMTAVLAMARALDVPEALVCEMLPAIEAVMVKTTKKDTEPDGAEAGLGQAEG